MRKLTIGDVTITSIIERDGPWRAPGQMFPNAPAEQIEATLRELEPETYDAASGKTVQEMAPLAVFLGKVCFQP